MRWWTFAGWRANLSLAELMAPLRTEVAAVDDLSLALDPTADVSTVAARLRATVAEADLAPPVVPDAIRGLKFSECLPDLLAHRVVASRLADPASVQQARTEAVAGWTVATEG